MIQDPFLDSWDGWIFTFHIAIGTPFFHVAIVHRSNVGKYTYSPTDPMGMCFMTCWELAVFFSMYTWPTSRLVSPKCGEEYRESLENNGFLFFVVSGLYSAPTWLHLMRVSIYLIYIYTWNPTANQFIMDGGLVISNHGTHVKIWFIIQLIANHLYQVIQFVTFSSLS